MSILPQSTAHELITHYANMVVKYEMKRNKTYVKLNPSVKTTRCCKFTFIIKLRLTILKIQNLELN